MSDLLRPIEPYAPGPLDEAQLVERVRLTLVSAGYALSMAPALTLGILTVLSVPLGVVIVGFALALIVVPATGRLASAHRVATGRLLGETLTSAYADTSTASALSRPVHWLRDPARWRDVGFLWFSATGGFVMSAVPVLLLGAPFTYLTFLVLDPSWLWLLLTVLGGALLFVWWFVTPALVRARLVAERSILDHGRVEALQRRVEHVEEQRTETLDTAASEIRRIERDLHDGAQARLAAVGMSVGLAEKLLTSDPEAAAELLREARENTVSALQDLRSVVRGIHPPVLADLGLVGAIEALALPIPLPVTVAVSGRRRLPDPVESAAYFAVAECLANTVKHADASRAWITGSIDEHRLRLVVGDDGRGGADASGAGLSGLGRRLAAFDGTVDVVSPDGGPTLVNLELPCPT